MEYESNIYLTGFMGTGKTSVGRILAERLGRKFVDTDGEIERREGRTISEIFREYGEEHFRALERGLCREIAGTVGLVTATGGGMPVDPGNRSLLSSTGLTVRLTASVPAVLQRVGMGRTRPKLGNDPSRNVEELLRRREPIYASAPFQVDTTARTASESANRVARIVSALPSQTRFLSVSLPEGGGYTVTVGEHTLSLLGMMLSHRGLTSGAAVVTDENLAALYLPTVLESLEQAGFRPGAFMIPPGEHSKTLSQLEHLYEAFLGMGIDRRGVVASLGGGVVGDLGGFAAATYMRGVALVQCPTSLLAMVDAGIGGKTGVDLPQGKNLVGAFKQPLAVVADTGTLKTLPDAERRVGMAEVIKHAIIDDPELFTSIERSGIMPPMDGDLVARSAGVKIRVIEEDPFESGRRAVVNLGHTVGHALEQAAGYTLSHGDAVSIGLAAAARISNKMGLCPDAVPDRVEAVLTRAGLPVRRQFDRGEVMAVMASDKKSVEGRVRFVLIRDIGTVEHGWEVDPHIVEEVLTELSI